jgi:hypothetical protein
MYLCGSSSHPGGNITGLPGYNATQVMLADFGLPPLRPGTRRRVRRGRPTANP